jgi:hypothetical protein
MHSGCAGGSTGGPAPGFACLFIVTRCVSTDGPPSADERADDLLLLLRRALLLPGAVAPSRERTPTTTTSSSSSSASTGRQRYLNHLRLATSLDLPCRSTFSAARSAVMGLGESACAETRDVHDAQEEQQQQEEEAEVADDVEAGASSISSRFSLDVSACCMSVRKVSTAQVLRGPYATPTSGCKILRGLSDVPAHAFAFIIALSGGSNGRSHVPCRPATPGRRPEPAMTVRPAKGLSASAASRTRRGRLFIRDGNAGVHALRFGIVVHVALSRPQPSLCGVCENET